jgi:cold shock CspA family protein
MTGRIKSWSAGSASGLITAENGVSVHFHSSAVLAYDIISLTVGQFVSFDLESGNCPRAANVCVLRHHHIAGVLANRQGTEQLRYMGFDQTESIRAYRFERVSPGEGTQTFIVTTDLALFRKHCVRLQEGPALCLHMLTAELLGADSIPRPPLQRALTDQDMLAHLASRPVPASRPRPKLTPRPHPVPHAV